MLQVGLLLILGTALLSAIVFFLTMARSFISNSIQGYNKFDEWAGHGLHGVVMTLMALDMGGWHIVELASMFWVFLLLVLIFAVLVAKRPKGTKVAAGIHAWICLGMAYMLVNTSLWTIHVTLLFVITLVILGMWYVKLLVQTLRSKDEIAERNTKALGYVVHTCMMTAMATMLVVMHWSTEFGLMMLHHHH